MRNILFALFGFLVITSNAQVSIYIPEPYGDNFIESELIGEVSIVPLQIERYGMISPDMEMKVDGNDYFILDDKKKQCVYHFNEEGQLVNTICDIKDEKEGEDLPILSNPAKFCLNPYKQQVEIYSFENSMVNRFTYAGELVDQMKLDISPADFVCDIRDNYWIYTGWHKFETQYRLLRADRNGNILDRRMRLITKCTPIEGYSFHISENGICLWELLGNTAYVIENKTITPTFEFDFGTHNLPENYHILNGDDSFMILMQKGHYSIKKYIENKNFAYFFLNYSNSSIQQKEMFHIIHNKKSAQTYIYTENAAIGAFNKAQYITKNDELVFLVSPRKLRQMLIGGAEFIPASFMDLGEEIKKLRNPIVLKMKIQSVMENSINDGYESSDSLYFEN